MNQILVHREASLDPEEMTNLRSDIAVATRRQAIRDSITPFASLVLDVTYDTILFAPAVVALATVSESSAMSFALILVFVIAVIASAISIFTATEDLTPFRRRLSSDTAIMAILATTAALLIAILALPFGLAALWRTSTFGLALALSLATLWLNNYLLKRRVSYPALSIIFLGNLVLVYACIRSVPEVGDMSAWASSMVRGAQYGLGGGAVLGLWIVCVELVNQVTFRGLDRATLRRIPEEEFVQSIVWSFTRIDADEKTSRRLAAWRQALVSDLDRLAGLLETHIPRQLARIDPRNAANLRTSFGHRAAVIHRWKRDILLGDDSAVDEVLRVMWVVCVCATNRRWGALPADDEYQVTETESVRARWWRAGRRLLVLVPPIAVLAFAIVNDQPGLATAAGGAAGLLLLEFVSPGSNDRVAKATAAGRELEPFAARWHHGTK
ncbi:hypothetical protein LL946_11815 [Knoellia locipacati]|uniref:hypothetical protein n=1 Tax=Knoellia locipacati TaxID=882824 RepID=UPI00384C1CBB